MTAVIEGPKGACLTQPLTGHTFSLRGQSNGLNEGDILALDKAAAPDDRGCMLGVLFSINPSLGFFYVRDEATGTVWGPFDSHNLLSDSWRLRLDEPS
jgi:hypothetical protein